MRLPSRPLGRCFALLLALAAVTPVHAGPIEDGLHRSLAGLDAVPLSTGVLLDRVVDLADIARFDGSAAAPASDLATWRQAYDELRRAASASAPNVPSLEALTADGRAAASRGVVPLALIDRGFERIRADAIARGALVARNGRLVPGSGSVLEQRRVTALAPLVGHTYRGAEVAFALDPARVFADAVPARVELDPGDGAGYRAAGLGERVVAHYATTGAKTIRIRFVATDGSAREAASTFDVRALATPTPDDTLHITASVPYQGVAGTGDAYVDLAPGHSAIVNPAVVIEGFDIDNTMNWDELYALLNEQNLLENLRAAGFDIVVLNFTDATDYLQRNSMVVAALIQQVEAQIAPNATIALAGASMGALCSRYALAYLEGHGGHRVRTWISFDGPHAGADIPLGLQYWIQFFSGQSSDAATFLGELNRPAARQMLVYHLTSPPTSTPAADPLRATFLADLASVGNWPASTRRVAIANGSGTGVNQGFLPGDQVIRYEYSNFLVTIKGDVWALANQTSKTIFDGRIQILFSNSTQTVAVGGAIPYDGAPGGWRGSMAELAASQAPYGTIVALYPNHCFIPTVSALALATTDPFYDIAGDPNLLGHSPFDALYVPAGDNQEHVDVTPENAQWVTTEVEREFVDVGPTAAALAAPTLSPAAPNPSAGGTRLAFTLPSAMPVTIGVYDLDGRAVRALAAGAFPAGRHEIAWDGRDERGRRARAGVYFVRMRAGSALRSVRLARIE
jgi:FlgD Ig-like domain